MVVSDGDVSRVMLTQEHMCNEMETALKDGDLSRLTETNGWKETTTCGVEQDDCK